MRLVINRSSTVVPPLYLAWYHQKTNEWYYRILLFLLPSRTRVHNTLNKDISDDRSCNVFVRINKDYVISTCSLYGRQKTLFSLCLTANFYRFLCFLKPSFLMQTSGSQHRKTDHHETKVTSYQTLDALTL